MSVVTGSLALTQGLTALVGIKLDQLQREVQLSEQERLQTITEESKPFPEGEFFSQKK